MNSSALTARLPFLNSGHMTVILFPPSKTLSVVSLAGHQGFSSKISKWFLPHQDVCVESLITEHQHFLMVLYY